MVDDPTVSTCPRSGGQLRNLRSPYMNGSIGTCTGQPALLVSAFPFQVGDWLVPVGSPHSTHGFEMISHVVTLYRTVV
jgi:hypothetical protein